MGARVGFTAVLHTWGSALTHHPHVHMVVPGGGLSSDGSRWIACKPRFFLPVRALSRLFRRLFLEGLAALHQAGRLAFFGDLVPLADRRALTAALAPLRRTEWVVYAKRPFAGPAAVLAYLSRYTHRVAISNSRLIASDDHSVTFRWKDYRARGETPGSTWIKAMTLPVDEFIRRFLMHVLPNGFHRIRHYGLFASPRRAANIAHLRELLANADDASQPFGDGGMGVADAASADLADAFAIAQICPCCGGRMSVVETFARGAQPRSFKADAARIDVMTAAPIPALAHDHDSPRGRGGMFPLTPPSSAAAKTVFRRSVAWASSLDPPSQIASNMPNHADHAGRLPRSTERPALKSP